MSKSVIITLTTAGADTGPFDIYGNHDNYNAAIVTNIAKSSLLSGYTCSIVPDAATILRVKSNNGSCTNYINLNIPVPSTTTTTTTTAVTTTTTTTESPTVTTTTTESPTITTTTTRLPINVLQLVTVGVPDTTLDYNLQLSNTTGSPLTYRLRLLNTKDNIWHQGPQHIVADGTINKVYSGTITSFGVSNVNGDTIDADLSNDNGLNWTAIFTFDPPYTLPYPV